MFFGLILILKDQIINKISQFVQLFSVIKKAMEAKLCLVLMLTIVGTLAVQGAIARNNKKNPLEVFARQVGKGKCFFDPLLWSIVNDCFMIIIISFKMRSWTWELEWSVIVSLCMLSTPNKRTTFSCFLTDCYSIHGYCTDGDCLPDEIEVDKDCPPDKPTCCYMGTYVYEFKQYIKVTSSSQRLWQCGGSTPYKRRGLYRYLKWFP